MNYKEFMERIQDYYGPFVERDNRGNIRKDAAGKTITSRVSGYVFAYLKRDIDERKLETLLRYVLYNHPYNFGPPDISSIEKSITEALRNSRGSDVHKTVGHNTMSELPEITEEERQETERLLQEKGGLRSMCGIKNIRRVK